jgi:hypothetical protein
MPAIKVLILAEVSKREYVPVPTGRLFQLYRFVSVQP